LKQEQKVIDLDNFATGHRRNIQLVLKAVTESQRARFTMIDGDIRHYDTCCKACRGATFVLHQAALGSVPRSIENPVATHGSNVTGFLNIIAAARESSISRFVYASSSSVYGDDHTLPKVEHRVGTPLSPYAATKSINETYA